MTNKIKGFIVIVVSILIWLIGAVMLPNYTSFSKAENNNSLISALLFVLTGIAFVGICSGIYLVAKNKKT